MICLAVWAVCLAAHSAYGINKKTRVDYTVKVASIKDQLFHVSAEIKDIEQPYLDVSLPIWIPGLYKVEGYAKNVLRFKIVDPAGKQLQTRMVGQQTWRVDTKGLNRINVDFDYRADVFAVNQARITNNLAYFTGHQLFVMAEGHRNSPSSVRFEVPEGWKVMSALKDTPDPMVFTASDYDTLVESPAMLGKFDLRKFEVSGKPHFLASAPEGAFPAYRLDTLITRIKGSVTEHSAIFGELPYDKYVFFYFLGQPDWRRETTLPSSNAQVAIYSPDSLPPDWAFSYVAAHEMFHLWNGRRIRPKEQWPYNYNQVTFTPLLWMLEGVTDYYARINQHRAGSDTRDHFLRGVEEIISLQKNHEARPYHSPANTSMLTWIDYEVRRPFLPPLNMQGALLAMLLDLSIREDTSNAASLDDVMRSLYKDFYKRGRGFSTEDLIGIINKTTGRDYNDFFNRYVWGVEMAPYDKVLAYAGYRYETYAEKVPVMGVLMVASPDGQKITEITPGSVAQEAGLLVGDVIMTIDEMNVRAGIAGLREWLTPNIGKVVKVGIKRGGEEKMIDLKIGSRDNPRHRISDLADVTPQQLKMRTAWLKAEQKNQAGATTGQNK
jgi:predicted metalloprotease with PDZ domain